MIQHLTHKVRTRRANRQLGGLLAIPRYTPHQTGVVTDLGIELGIHPTIPGLFFAGGLLGARAFKQVGFIATVPLALVLSAVAAPPLWQDVDDGMCRWNRVHP